MNKKILILGFTLLLFLPSLGFNVNATGKPQAFLIDGPEDYKNFGFKDLGVYYTPHALTEFNLPLIVEKQGSLKNLDKHEVKNNLNADLKTKFDDKSKEHTTQINKFNKRFISNNFDILAENKDYYVINFKYNIKAATDPFSVDVIPEIAGYKYIQYAWFNSDWSYKKKITFNSSQIPSTQTNFPVCIDVTDTDLKNNAQSDGDDICFVNSAEDTQLNHEIELYDNTDGSLVAWVNVTSLAHDSNTEIYMYYGNAGATNQENIINVWHSNFKHVHHFIETSGNPTDSTSNNNDFDGTGGNPNLNVNGIVGSGIYLDGDDYIYDTAGSSFLDSSVPELTVIEWVNYDNGGDGMFLDMFETSGGNGGFTLRNGGVDTRYNTYDSNVGSWVFMGDIADFSYGDWNMLSYVADGTSLYGYLNGNQQDSESLSANLDMDYNNNDIDIGRQSQSDSLYVTGYVDEFYIYEGVLSGNWLKTYFNNLNNATDGGFFSLGSQTPNSPPQISGVNPANNSIDQDLSFTWNCTITDDNTNFNYSIECDNGQSTNQNNVGNGSKTLSLSSLNYGTTYKVYVNVTENTAGGLVTRAWYNFTTINVTSSVDTITPYNVTTTPLTLTVTNTSACEGVYLYYRNSTDNATWSPWVNHTTITSDPVTYDFNFPNGTGYYEFYSRGFKTGYTESAPPTCDARCNASLDLILITNKTTNLEYDGATLNTYLQKDKGEAVTVYFEYGATPEFGNTTASTTLREGGTYSVDISGLDYAQHIYYRARGNDSTAHVNGSTKEFITRPQAPSNASATSHVLIELSWDKAATANKTVIIAKSGSAPTGYSDGTEIYNDTGESYNYEYSLGGAVYYFAFYSYAENASAFSLSPVEDFEIIYISTLNDTVPPYIELNTTANNGFNISTMGTFNITAWDNFEGTIFLNITVNDFEYYNLTVDHGNNTGDYNFNLSENGENTFCILASDIKNNSNWYNYTVTIYFVNISLVDERTGDPFDWSRAKTSGNMTACTVTVDDKGYYLDIYTNENTSFYYISENPDVLRFESSYANTESKIIRKFSIDLLDPASNIGLVENETQFYAQLIYASQNRPTIVKNLYSDCYIFTGHLSNAYTDYYAAEVHTIDMNYYLYTYSNGQKVYLSTLEGSNPSNINMGFLTYQNDSYDFSILSDAIAVNKVAENTLKIYYKNLKADNTRLEVKIYDGSRLIFNHLETSTPNEFLIYFDYSTITLSNEMLKLKVTATKANGQSEVIERYISKDAGQTNEALLSSEVAAVLSVSLILFGLTFVSSKYVFGYFGIIIIFAGVAITTICPQVWYITFIQVIEIILVVIMFMIFKNENPHIT